MTVYKLPDEKLFYIPHKSVMQGIISDLLTPAKTKLPILILGESGTGKELIARLIHVLSPRDGKPIIAVNTAGLSLDRAEDLFFGHEKGAFTSAIAVRKGVFEEVNGGTLFLDEIGDMHREVQPQLLRVLQEGVYQRIGGNKDIRVDVRVVAATNQPIQALVENGTIRKDLFYRLAAKTVTLPPLRERKQDIPDMATFFANKVASDYNINVRPKIAKDALSALMAFNWPGNVRQFEYTMGLAAFQALQEEDKTIKQKMLPAEMQQNPIEIDSNRGREYAALVARLKKTLISNEEKISLNQVKSSLWDIMNTFFPNKKRGLIKEIYESTLNSPIKDTTQEGAELCYRSFCVMQRCDQHFDPQHTEAFVNYLSNNTRNTPKDLELFRRAIWIYNRIYMSCSETQKPKIASARQKKQASYRRRMEQGNQPAL